MDFPEDSSRPQFGGCDLWEVRPNDAFARDARCLLFAGYSQSHRDCQGCRTIAWCKYYDHFGTRLLDRLAFERWEDDGGTPYPLGLW